MAAQVTSEIQAAVMSLSLTVFCDCILVYLS